MADNSCYLLNNWVVRFDVDSKGEESDEAYAMGEIYNHPSYEDGTVFQTTHITNMFDNKIYTKSGNVYYLLKPSEEYLEFLKEENKLKELEQLTHKSNN